MPKYSLEDINYLTSIAFSAALDSGKWQSVVDEAARMIGGVKAHIFGYDFDIGLHLGQLYSGYDPDYALSFERYYASINPWGSGFLKADAGIPVTSEWMCQREIVERGEFYSDWVLPQEDIIAGGGALLFNDGHRLVAFGGNLRRKDQDLESEWMDFIELIVPHLQQAFEINRRLQGLSLEKIALAETPSPRDAAVVLVNGHGRILFTTRSADALIEIGDVIRSDLRGRLQFESRSAGLLLDAALRQLRDGTFRVPRSFRVVSLNRGMRYLCHTGWLDPQALAQDRSPIGALVGAQEPALIVILSPEPERTGVAESFLGQFGLTRQEVQVVRRICDGMTTREISELREVSIHTVRNQLKSAMSKLDVRRQADLVGFLSRLDRT